MSLTSQLRRTRFVCISDTHNSLPKLPAGDVLIHAGDLTNQGTFSELQKTVAWLEKAPFECKLVVAGNHDITLDPLFYEKYGSRFHNQNAQNADECIRLLKGSSSLTYLKHEAKAIRLTKEDGPQTHFTVFGSPYSPSRGLWAFGYAAEEADALWAQVPLDSDIVITHTPPKSHCDESPSRGSAGCEALRQALWRVRPRLAVCGHVHEARGAQTVVWDLHSPTIKYQEAESIEWKISEAGKKNVRVDLTSRSLRPLRNDGAVRSVSSDDLISPQRRRRQEIINMGDPSYDSRTEDLILYPPRVKSPLPPPSPGSETPDSLTSPTQHHSTTVFRETRGPVGDSSSGTCDTEAVLGCSGRVETCIVNASILGSSFPHHAGKRFHQPIVVDLELPVANYDSRP